LLPCHPLMLLVQHVCPFPTNPLGQTLYRTVSHATRYGCIVEDGSGAASTQREGGLISEGCIVPHGAFSRVLLAIRLITV
jgi:hypothetical protein